MITPELLAPAGNLDKLEFAYRYGADAAYLGLPGFSLRNTAEPVFSEAALAETAQRIRELKGSRKLYGAVNLYFTNADLRSLEQSFDTIAALPFDALICSDLGAWNILRRRFPDMQFHLSTQANTCNWQAAQVYADLGFSRIVAARELSLDEVAEIKQKVPHLELEVFVHGAMCMSYSGRCLLSAETCGRSANAGDCAHNCRWKYRLYMEEESRPGKFIPVETGSSPNGAYTALLSSRDLCTIDHVDKLRAAGVDSLKIEGRMKSIYYCAAVTRAYRWAVDNPGQPSLSNPYRKELFEVSHREFGTGFFFGNQTNIASAESSGYKQSHQFVGALKQHEKPGLPDSCFEVLLKNSFSIHDEIELLGPQKTARKLAPGNFRLYDEDGRETERLFTAKPGYIEPIGVAAAPFDLLRAALKTH